MTQKPNFSTAIEQLSDFVKILFLRSPQKWSRMIFLKKLSRMILRGNEVIEKDSILWRASECPCECDSAVTSPIIPIELKSIDPEEEF